MTTKDTSTPALSLQKWVNTHNSATTDYRTTSLNDVRDALRKHTDYQTIFAESEATSSVDHDSSILSPAAYFVDLMRLIEVKVTNGTQNNWESLGDLKLEQRRPDLWEAELDAKNTTNEVPYLEIVNNVLRTHLTLTGVQSVAEELTVEQKQRERKLSARKLLAKAQYPFDLPVHMPLLQIRTDLAHFGIELTDIYETFRLPEENDAWVAEALGLSPLELGRLLKPEPDATDLCKAYGFSGIKSETQLGGIDVVETFLKQTGLTPDELGELMHVMGVSLVKDEEGLPVEPVRIKGLDLARLDHWNHFIRLRKRLGWSFSDLHWALRSIGSDLAKRNGEDPEDVSKKALVDKDTLPELAQVKKFCDKYKLAVDVVCSFYVHDMNTTPGFAVPNQPEPKSLFDRVFNTPSFYQSEGSEGGAFQPWETKADPWDSTSSDLKKDKRNQAIRASLLAALNVGNDDLQAIVDHICKEKLFTEQADADRVNAAAIPLDLHTLTRLYSFSKMASVLGMRVPEYLALLRCISRKDQVVPRLKAPEISSVDDLRTVEYWADWLKKAGLNPYQLKYLTKGVMTPEARCRFDPGWTEEGLTQLIPALYATLKLRLIKPESFVQSGTISSVEATGVTTALLQADLIVDVAATEAKEKSSEFMGLVKCPISAASTVSEKLPRVSRLHVIDALKHLAKPDVVVDAAKSAARDLVCFKASFPDKENRTEVSVTDFEKIVKALQVAKDEPQGDLKGEASTEEEALLRLTEYCKRAEMNQDQLEELCGLVINASYFRQEEDLATFICLAKEFRWSFTDLHLVLRSVKGNQRAEEYLTEETLARVWKIKCLQEKLKIPLDLICNFIMELLTAGGDAVFDIPSFTENLADSGEDKDRASSLAAIRDELLRKAAAIQAITDTLNRELDFQMQSTIQQLASTFSENWPEVAITVDYLNWKERGAAKFLTHDGLRDAGLLLYLAKSLKLSVDAFDAVLKTPSLFGFDSSRSNIRINLDTIRTVHAFAGLVETFQQQGSREKETAPLLAELAQRWSFDELNDADKKNLETLGGWPANQIGALHGHLSEMSAKGGVTGLATMKRSFDLATKLGVDVQMLIQLCKLHDAQTDFEEISAAAHSLLGVVKSKYSNDDWEKIFGPIRDNLNERERDALVGLLMHQLSQNEDIAKHFDGMDSLQDLSDYLLIDVEMSGVAKVSKVKQGLNTLQRYIQRCHMGLEAEGKVTCPVGDKEWAWRSHYRLWEANRKVFLYPENYLDPGLRKIKTPLFKELEDELLQGDINKETVEQAYIHYFDKLDELASLEIVDACAAMVTHPGTLDGEQTLFFIGRTKKQPPVYYYRSAVLEENVDNGIREWEEKNEGLVNVPAMALAVSPDGRALFAGTYGGGVFRSLDNGETWKPKNKGLNNEYVYALAVTPDGPALFAGTAGGGVFRSLDNGETWEEKNKGLTSPHGYALAVSPDGPALFAGTDGGVFRSLDNGETWKPKNEKLTSLDVRALAVSPDGPALFAGTNGGVFRSLDNGETWKPKNEKLTNLDVRALAVSPDGPALFAGTNGGVFRSLDNGETWKPKNEKLTNLDVRALAVSPDGRALFAGTNGGVFRSLDNGETWKPKNEKLTNLDVRALAVSPDGRALFAGTYGWGVFRSLGNIQVLAWRPWQKIALSIPVDTVTCLYANHSLHLFWVEEKMTIDRADVSGTKTTTTKATVKFSYHNVSGSWFPPQILPGLENVIIEEVDKDQPSKFDFLGVNSPFPPDRPVANLILSKPAEVTGGKPRAMVSFRCPNSQDAAKKVAVNLLPKASIVDAFIPIDEDSGIDFDAFRTRNEDNGLPDQHVRALAVSPDGQSLFAGICAEPGHGGVFRSDDKGEKWVKKNGEDDKLKKKRVMAFAVSSDGRSLFAGIYDAGGVFRSDDKGEKWEEMSEGLKGKAVTALAVSPDGRSLFAGTYRDGGVFRYDDKREKWVVKNVGLWNEGVLALVLSPDGRSLFAGTSGGGVFCSDDKGEHWVEKNTGLEKNEHVRALAVSPDGRYLFAGANGDGDGGGVFRSENHGETWVQMGRDYGLMNKEVYALAVSLDGRYLFAGANGDGDGGGVFRYDDKREIWVKKNKGLKNEKVTAFAMSLDGRSLVAGTEGGGVFCSEDRRPWSCIVMDPAGASTNTILGTAAGQGKGSIYRVGSHAVEELRKDLITGGLNILLSPWSQKTPELPLTKIAASALKKQSYPSKFLDFHLSSSYAIYYREIFFHIPFLIADTLNRNQCFEDAQRWYHYIFNPIPQTDTDGQLDGKDKTPFWRYLPFKHHTLEKLQDIEKNNPGEFKIYTDDPFDPHAIAGLRLGAYEKAIVMKYIDNLLDWGDQLFAQDSWEAIVEAMMLYVLAQDLLGKKPKQTRPTHSPKPIKRYDQFDNKVDFADPFHVEDTTYFPVAPNTNFAGYWDRADDRLFKIRHCMNIKGVVRQLSLFQPPIDPRQLIRAMAAGQDLTSVAGQLSAPIPHYRFTTMIQQAKNVTSSLTQLGSTLLSALEKKDAEQLNLLRSTHEKTILNLATRVKEKQIDDAKENFKSLEASLKGAEFRKKHYGGLSEITEETSSLNLAIAALSFHTATPVLHALTVPAYLAPSIFGLADGGSKWGQALAVAPQVSDSTANIFNQGSQLAATKAQNIRRKEDWELQKKLATHDVEQITAEIEGAKAKRAIAQMDLDMHQKSIEQAGEMEDLLRTKFTNRDLYQWMVGRISSVYFQTYKIAFDLAQAAEKAYHYERNSENTDTPFIRFGYWDSLKKGLLTGESLMLSLNQLEKAYMDDNERTLEIEKTFSLFKLDAMELANLKNPEKRTCTISLLEKHFDKDFPGHYCRKIKSISITLPAVVGPYQNVQAILRQDRSRLLPTKDMDGVKMLLDGLSKSDSVYSGLRPLQQVAISKGVDDSGLFELNFRDERYLPFEGTGAVSDWTLDMRSTDQEVLASISDVIVHLRYTAKDGGEEFRGKVEELVPRETKSE